MLAVLLYTSLSWYFITDSRLLLTITIQIFFCYLINLYIINKIIINKKNKKIILILWAINILTLISYLNYKPIFTIAITIIMISNIYTLL